MKSLYIILPLIVLSLTMNTAKPTHIEKSDMQYFETIKVAKMISTIKPKLCAKKTITIAANLNVMAKRFKIDPKIIIAIIDTESDFDNSKISSTGDLSLAQINLDVWNKELKRLKLPEINQARVKTDEKYALNQMGLILSILKKRHAKNDKNWFARYHSQTPKYKMTYLSKVELRMRKIASIN